MVLHMDGATPPSAKPGGNSVRRGACVWLVASVLLVAVRGVRWDENYEFAQVLLGHVQYPPGHPLPTYLQTFFSGQTWLLSGFMTLFEGPLLPNALRNVLVLAAVTVPPFLLTTLLTRRVWAGHLTVVLLLAEVHTAFLTNYPAQVWPDLYSNGIVGQGFALLTLYVLVRGGTFNRALCVGLMPAVHLGQAPPALCAALCHAYRRRGSRPRFRSILRGLAPGALLTGWLLLQVSGVASPFREDPGIPGVYDSEAPASSYFAAYMEHFASHRATPDASGLVPLLLALPLALMLTQRSGRTREAAIHSAVYLAVVAGASALGWAGALVAGPQGLQLVQGWMPYRLLNHAAPLGLALAVAVCAGLDGGRARWWPVLAALVLLLARPGFERVLPAEVYAAYWADGVAAFCVLLGGAWGALAPRVSRPLAVACMAAWLALATLHQWGALMTLVGIAIGLLTWQAEEPTLGQRYRLNAALVLTGVALTAGLLAEQYRARTTLPAPRDFTDMRATLAAEDRRHLVLVPPQQEGWQARLDQAVTTDMATITWIPYNPRIGQRLDKMYAALYGIDLLPERPGRVIAAPWPVAWPSHIADDWMTLHARHGFTHVLVPTDMNLRLPVAVAGEHYTLYEVKHARSEAL